MNFLGEWHALWCRKSVTKDTILMGEGNQIIPPGGSINKWIMRIQNTEIKIFFKILMMLMTPLEVPFYAEASKYL